jgi:hypothetical protein
MQPRKQVQILLPGQSREWSQCWKEEMKSGRHINPETGRKPAIDPSHNWGKTAARLAVRRSQLFLGIITTTKIEPYSTIFPSQRRIYFQK